MAETDPQNLSFGSDAAGYDAGRLDYPPALYGRLADAGLVEGARVFEIGAGTGIATARMLSLRPSRLTAVEPDPRMAALLADRLGANPALEVTVGSFEDTDFEPGAYDLGTAATAFHWCDATRAATCAFGALIPGGRLVLFWNVYRSFERNDAFGRAVAPFIAAAGDDAEALRRSLPDLSAIAKALEAAGFAAMATDRIDWSITLSPMQNRALYASMSMTRALPADRRQALLDAIEATARDGFPDPVERQFHTLLIEARRPPS
ncbi:MAG: methyltransferase domain-containing protein [Pseudomonadota bacterium]